jgi:hypothetical protein
MMKTEDYNDEDRRITMMKIGGLKYHFNPPIFIIVIH